MFWQKRKGGQNIKNIENPKKGVPVADPTPGEHMLGLNFRVCHCRWNFSIM